MAKKKKLMLKAAYNERVKEQLMREKMGITDNTVKVEYKSNVTQILELAWKIAKSVFNVALYVMITLLVIIGLITIFYPSIRSAFLEVVVRIVTELRGMLKG